MRSVTEISPGVHVATSRHYTTTSTIVVRDRAAIVVDPAWDPDELDDLAALFATRRWDAAFGIATHAHHDHVLWHPRFGDAPRYATEQTVALARAHRGQLVAALGDDWPTDLADLVGRLSVAPPQLDANESVELIAHDGHAPGHAAVWFPERRLVLAGDMLSDVELPLPFDPDDLPAYLSALDTLAPIVARADWLVPGHGNPTDRPLDRLDADRAYLDALISGNDPDDSRRALPGMAEAHARLLALARSTPGLR